MRKIVTLLFVALMITLNMNAEVKPTLKFNKKGKFKIIQFTDVHFQYNSYRSDSALNMIVAAIKNEKPDLVVFTGDVVCSKNTKQAWLSFTKPFTEAKIPWAVVLGNHDIEYEITGSEIMETISGLPFCVTENGPKDISGNGNYILKIKSHDSSKTEALLYFIDSHSGLKKENGFGSYDWIKFDQIQWYREQSKKLTKENKEEPYPALAFFHIPLPEFNEIWGKQTTTGLKEESVCSPDINSGMYDAFLEMKDVMGMFVGHDHDNNYIGCLRNICLGYGQASGRESYGNIGKGYRVIELFESERKFETWVCKKYISNRDKDIWEPANSEEKLNFVTYPVSFSE